MKFDCSCCPVSHYGETGRIPPGWSRWLVAVGASVPGNEFIDLNFCPDHALVAARLFTGSPELPIDIRSVRALRKLFDDKL